MARPLENKPYRQRRVRFSYMEDTLRGLLDKVQDPEARLEIQKVISTEVARQRVLEDEVQKKKRKIG